MQSTSVKKKGCDESACLCNRCNVRYSRAINVTQDTSDQPVSKKSRRDADISCILSSRFGCSSNEYLSVYVSNDEFVDYFGKWTKLGVSTIGDSEIKLCEDHLN